MIFYKRPLSGALLVTTSLFIIFQASRHGTFSPYYQSANHGQYFPNNDGSNNKNLEESHAENPNATPVIKYLDRIVKVPGPPTKDSSCNWMPNSSKIMLTMKTGASESHKKIPTQLITTLRCIQDFLVFSDMKQTIAGVDIHDSLQTVLQEAMDGNPEFDLYRRQYTCAIDQENCSKELEISSSSAGWNLDKYKNIHIAEMTYEMRPEYDWYMTVDADTYVLWPNLVTWLSKMDPSKKRYIGSVTNIADFPFGHGGSGYIMSGAAMENFVGGGPGVANKYDKEAEETCCGDYMLAKALKEVTGIGVENAWPTINGEKPFTLSFGPNQWCHPVVTMHHMNSEEISAFWEFEKGFYQSHGPSSNRSLLLKDIYKEFLEPRLQAKREDWDNLSEDQYYLDPNAKEYESWQVDRAKKNNLSDIEKSAHESFEDCANMCDEVEECFQFRFQDGICAYQRGFLLGKPKKKEEEESQRWISGWPVQKIQAWVDAHQDCEEHLWPTLN